MLPHSGAFSRYTRPVVTGGTPKEACGFAVVTDCHMTFRGSNPAIDRTRIAAHYARKGSAPHREQRWGAYSFPTDRARKLHTMPVITLEVSTDYPFLFGEENLSLHSSTGFQIGTVVSVKDDE